MSAVGQLMLLLGLLGLLVSTNCEVRARDPSVEDEEGGVLLGFPNPNPERQTGNYPARTGNLCAFVQKRVVTMAVACGTEKFTIRSQSPCPSGYPDCQLTMYKLSTRPVYRQKQKILTSLQWRCCPGHGGTNCEDIEGSALNLQQQQFVNLNQEQNDHQASSNTSDPTLDTTRHHLRPDQLHNSQRTRHPPVNMFDRHPHPEQKQQVYVADEVQAAVLPSPEDAAALPVAQIVELVMYQLRPVLDGFNRSLESLSHQVGDLTRNMDELKSDRRGSVSPNEAEQEDGAAEILETRLDEISQQILVIRQHMENQRVQMEHRLHSQHAMLHYNLTIFKTDIDLKLKRHQKMLQMSLQSINTTLSELKPNPVQEQGIQKEPQELLTPPPQTSSDTSTLWKAIELLDNKVVNNTVKVSSISEDMDVTFGEQQLLRRALNELEKQINQTARKSQVLFMETGLEVEDARVVVLQRVEELARNLTKQDQRLQEMDVDVDYLYTAKYQHNATSDCDCRGLKAAIAHLQGSLANVTELVNDNSLALDESGREGMSAGSGAHDWQELQLALQQVRNLVSTEQSRTRKLEQDLIRTNSLLLRFQEDKVRLEAEVKHLSASFSSLLKDAVRHSEVLELLLGEEVLEFLDWPLQDQEGHSIPILKEQLNLLLEQQGRHRKRLVESEESGNMENVLSANQPFASSSSSLADDWPSVGVTSRLDAAQSRERQMLHHTEAGPGGGHDGLIWFLRQKLEEAELRLVLLEAGPPCSCSGSSTQESELQLEVGRLKRGLEEHLRVFKTVFRNADVLIAADSQLELDKLWQLLRNKAEKRERTKKGAGRKKQTEGE